MKNYRIELKEYMEKEVLLDMFEVETKTEALAIGAKEKSVIEYNYKQALGSKKSYQGSIDIFDEIGKMIFTCSRKCEGKNETLDWGD